MGNEHLQETLQQLRRRFMHIHEEYRYANNSSITLALGNLPFHPSTILNIKWKFDMAMAIFIAPG